MISWGGIELLPVDREIVDSLAPWACKLARRIGLDVSNVNELVWPNGADRFGGMIGVIEAGRVEKIREKWAPWRNGNGPTGAGLPTLSFYGSGIGESVVEGTPTMLASLAALEPVDAHETAGLWFVALTDIRRTLQERLFAASTDPTLVDWPTAIDAVVGTDGPDVILSHTIDAARLAPEIDDPRTLAMTRGEWLEAAAHSVGGRWRLRSSGELELQSATQAIDVETDNRERCDARRIDGRFDQEIARPIARVSLCVRESRGAVPWPRGERNFNATDPAIDAETGLRWNPKSTALWERAPVDSSQENAPELQALADALLADVQAWHATEHLVRFGGFVKWNPSARDRCVRWISYDDTPEGCCTIVESVRLDRLPSLLIHRSAVVPREGSIVQGVAETSADPGDSVTVELAATTGRPARRVVARVPSNMGGCSVCADQGVWLDYDRSAGEWILLPWGTFVASCAECGSGSESGSGSDSGSGSGSGSGSASGSGSESGSASGSGSGSASASGSASGSGSGSGSASASGSGSGSSSGSASGSASGSGSGSGSGGDPIEVGCCPPEEPLIDNYAFTFSSGEDSGGAIPGGGCSLIWDGVSQWVGTLTVRAGTATLRMSCSGGTNSREFTLTVDGVGSYTDTSPSCNPILCQYGTVTAASTLLYGSEVAAA